jgi:hypothetical protein
MEARKAETPDVALAAPFTTARPPEAGRPKDYQGIVRRASEYRNPDDRPR